MSNIDRKIALFNLLHTRSFVSMDTINMLLKIPKRTAYRYLNQFSEVNIPIYFDNEVKGYRLNKDNFRNDYLKPEDCLLLIIGLKCLSFTLNKSYQDKVDMIIKELILKQNIEIEKVLGLYENHFDNTLLKSDNTDLVNSILISLANLLLIINNDN